MTDVYVPEVGDRVNYSEGAIEWTNSQVTKTERFGGYTAVWLDGCDHDNDALFNVNHTTGLPNTTSSRNGRLSKVRAPRTFTLAPPAPADVTRVRSVSRPQLTYRLNQMGRWINEQDDMPAARTWSALLTHHSDGVVEIRETEYEAACRRLKADQLHEKVYTVIANRQQLSDIKTVVARAIENLDAENA